METVIVLDPGHGGADSGTTAGGLVEKDYQLQIGLLLRDSLLAKYTEIQVVMTRETDREVNPNATSLGSELQARCDIANAFPDAVLISLHHDAHSAPEPNGNTLYVYGPVSWVPAVSPDGTLNHQAPRSYNLAQRIIPTLARKLAHNGIKTNGIKSGNFQVLRETNNRAILMEGFFATNPLDSAVARKAEFPALLADAYCEALGTALSLTPKPADGSVRILLPDGSEVIGELRSDSKTWFQIPGTEIWAPVRVVAEAMGRTVTWTATPPTVSIS